MYGGAIADYASMVFPVIGEYTKLGRGVGIITLFFAATIRVPASFPKSTM